MRRAAVADVESIIDSAPGRRRTPVERRARRVVVLLAAVLVLSAADLVVTIGHLRATGMPEANPIAAYLIRTTGSPLVLSLYKGTTVALCVGVLYCVRRSRAAEAAAWLSVGILTVMSIYWHDYNSQMGELDQLRMAQAEHAEHWLRLD